jgi:hypothetical protein
MPDELPRKPRLPDSFAAFDIDPRRPSGRRKSRWSINPRRAEARASAEAAGLSRPRAAITRGIGRKSEHRMTAAQKPEPKSAPGWYPLRVLPDDLSRARRPRPLFH